MATGTEAVKYALRMEGITHAFPGVLANDHIHLAVRRGTFHAVIGENGAGKSTLLNILFGKFPPDEGRIWIEGEEVTGRLNSSADAIKSGIGLVSQHYSLIPALTVLENLLLGAEEQWIIPFAKAVEPGKKLAEQLGMEALDFFQPASQLSVASRQKVEILKALYRGAKILLLDEPTATLAPSESDTLFALLKRLRDKGITVVFVTHKLREVMTHSDAVTVLRSGKNAGDFQTAQTTPGELLRAMIGEKTGPGNRRESSIEATEARVLLEIRKLSVSTGGIKRLHEVDLQLNTGEILGIAGVDGSGQSELVEAVLGLRKVDSGEICLNGSPINSMNTGRRREAGLGYIAEDRHDRGMIDTFTVAENYVLGLERRKAFGGGLLLNWRKIAEKTRTMLTEYDVRLGSDGALTRAGSLSGGNQQKLVVARELDAQPSVLLACQPTRGLDVNASATVHQRLQNARDNGVGVMLFSLDLDETLALSDRIAVLYNGRVAGVLARKDATSERVGALMTGAVD